MEPTKVNAYIGYLARGRGRWYPAVTAPTYASCWAALLAIPTPGPGTRRLVRPATSSPP